MAEETSKSYDIQSMLSEMRDNYWQALSEEEETREEQLDCITFDLGGETYAFETVYAAEVIRMPRLVKVPKVQDIIVGVFNLRGEITAALDVRPFLGLPQPPLGSAARIIVVKGEKFLTGMLVEMVRGVSGLPLNDFEPAVKSLSGMQREYIRGQLNVGGNVLMLMDIKRLLAAPEIVVDHKS